MIIMSASEWDLHAHTHKYPVYIYWILCLEWIKLSRGLCNKELLFCLNILKFINLSLKICIVCLTDKKRNNHFIIISVKLNICLARMYAKVKKNFHFSEIIF